MKKGLRIILITLVILVIIPAITGQYHLYKALWNTYLKGRSGPSINEYPIFENNVVAAGTPQKWPLSKSYNKIRLTDKCSAIYEQYKTSAYLIIKNDSIVFEHYWNGYSDTTHSNSFSMAKTIVSILTGIAIDKGLIKSIEQPLGDFIPEFRGGENDKLKIKHLLTMSSAINFDEDYVSPFAYPAKAYYGDDLEQLTLSYKVTGEPGKDYIYLSGNTTLLAMAIEKASKKTLSDFASENLWKPIGAEQPAFWSLDHASGQEKAYCCFNSNARDFARIGKLYLDSGRYNGKQIVSQQYVLNSIQPAQLLDNGVANTIYGYNWWILSNYKGHNIFYARGILGQYIFVIPDKDMVIVRLGEERSFEQINGHPVDVYDYLNCALEMYK